MNQTNERPCFIHIGTHKTGTTSIQAFLAANRAQLLQAGVFIPVSAGDGDIAFAGHHGIVRELLGRPRFASDVGCFAAVASELAATDLPRACLSSEDFSLLFDRPDLLDLLRATVTRAGFTPKILAYARPQASYSVAIYAANVESGYRLPFDAFLEDIVRRGCYVWDGGYGPPFDYSRLLDPFAAVFGHDAVIVRVFCSDAPDGALIESFTDLILSDPSLRACLFTPAKRANRTLTFASVLRLLGTENSLDEHVRFAPLTPAGLLRLWLRFRGANRVFARQYGARVPVLEPLDVLRAIPLRRTPHLTRQLLAARKALRSRSHRA